MNGAIASFRSSWRWAAAGLWAAAILAGTPDAAEAYIGPGAGLSAIGSLIALVAAVAVAFVGFVWFPVKRLLKGRRNASGQQATQGAAKGDQSH
ncbi:MAG: hypothetical protein ACFB6S_19990 [Geminicoccaceae bacterium]